MPDLAAQIRERLDGWAPPEPWLTQFADAEPRTPDELAALTEDLSRAIEVGAMAGPVLVLPPSPRFYPGFEQMRAAILAALDALMLLKRELPESELTAWEKGVVDQAGLVQKAIAGKLGIEVDRG